MSGPVRTFNEAAAELRVSRRWLQDFLKKHPVPILRAGHKKLFDDAAMRAIRALMRDPNAPRELIDVLVPPPKNRLERLLDSDKRNREGFIYFIACGDLVKIGFSRNVKMRMAELQTGSPHKLSLVHVERGKEQDERAFHRAFEQHRHSGEWFKFEGALKAFIYDKAESHD